MHQTKRSRGQEGRHGSPFCLSLLHLPPFKWREDQDLVKVCHLPFPFALFSASRTALSFAVGSKNRKGDHLPDESTLSRLLCVALRCIGLTSVCSIEVSFPIHSLCYRQLSLNGSNVTKKDKKKKEREEGKE